MFKNKFFIFLILAFLSIGVVSAEDSSNVDIAEVQDSVSTVDELILNNGEINTLKVDEVSSNVVESKENDSSEVASQSTNDNEDEKVLNFNALNNEINGAKGNTLNLNHDYEYTSGDIASGITITQSNFVIDGQGHTIDAKNKDVRIFNIAGNNVSIKNLIFANAKYENGAVIYAHTGVINIDNCTFSGNVVTNDGGAIYNDGGTLTITNSAFVGNSATTSGNAIYNKGGSLTISNSAFVGNSATTSGNAIYNNGGIVTANDNWWADNEISEDEWNALINSNVATTHDSYAVLNLTATNSIAYLNFYRNGTNTTISIPTRDVTLTIKDNDKYLVEGSIVDGFVDLAYDEPVGKYTLIATVDGVETTLDLANYKVYVATNGSNENNGSSWNSPFATIEHAVEQTNAFEGPSFIYIADGIYKVDNQIRISKSITIIGQSETIITDKEIDDNKCVFAITSGVDEFVIVNCTFVNITATDTTGGVIYNAGKNSIVSNCNFYNITSKINYGIISNVGVLTVINSSFKNDDANTCFDIYNFNGATLNLTNNSYSNVEDIANIYNLGTIGTPVIIDVLGNKTVSYPYTEDITLVATITTGDGASVAGGKLTFDEDIIGGVATPNNNGTYTLEINDNIGVNEYLINATYTNGKNVTTNTGILNIVKANATINVSFDKIEDINDNVTINVNLPVLVTGNVAVTINNKTYNVTLTKEDQGQVKIITDKLERGVYEVTVNYEGDDNYNANMTIVNIPVGIAYVNPVSGNDKTNWGSSWDDAFETIEKAVETITNGGIIYLAGVNHEVANQITIDKSVVIVGKSSAVITDTKSDDGKAIFYITANNVDIVNCTFANIDSLVSGSAIVNIGSNSTVSNCTFINNIVSGSGGAIYNKGVNFTVIGSTFINNTASSEGAAICNNNADNFTVISSTFVNNTAINNGGAIYNKGTGSVISNSTFINNTATNNGAAIINKANSNLEVINSEFDGNDASTGAAIYNDVESSLNVTGNSYSGLTGDKTYIYNAGKIISPILINISGNKTLYSKVGTYVVLDATITTENGVSVAIPEFNLKVGNDNLVTISPKDGVYYGSYEVKEPVRNTYQVITISDNVNDYFDDMLVLNSALDTRTIPNMDVVIGNITYGEDLVVNVDLNDDANGTVTVIIYDAEGSVVSTKTVYVDVAKNYVVSDELLPGDYTANIAYNGFKDKYAVKSTTTEFTISKISVYNMSSIINDIKIGENATLIICLPETVTGDVSTIIGGKTYIANVNKGVAIIKDISDLSANTYDIAITYNGNDIYESKTITDSFTVSKISDYTINIITPTITVEVGDNATITIKISQEDADGKVSVSVNGKIFYADVNGGVATLNLTGLTAGSHTIAVNYTGNDKYADKVVNSSITVFKIANYEFSINANDIKVGDDAIITVSVPEDAEGRVIINISGINHVAVIEDGVATFNVTGLTNGVHDIFATYDGDYKYLSSNTTGSINVTKISDYDMLINISTGVKVGDNFVINVVVPYDATGKVVIKVNGKDYEASVEDSLATITADAFTTDGIYYITATYDGNNKYTSNDASASIGVSKVDVYDMNITISEEIFTDENTTVSVDFPEDATGNVTVTVNDQNYTVEVKNGTADVIIPALSTGDYNVTIAYLGDNKYAANSVNKTITVISKDVNLTTKDVVMIYHDGARLYAVLVDAQGNAIVNATISFTINGVSYNRTTDVNGSASIALNLDCGKYSAIISYAGNTTYNPANINASVIINSSIIGNDIVKMYQNDTQFYATFLGEDGKALANTTVRFNINGVFYNRTTDVNGTVRLNINLNPGNFTLIAYNPNGEEKRYNVLVKSLIEPSDLTKYYHNASAFEVKVYNKDGTVGANQTVTFNVNGVFYTRIANEKGIVRFGINLNPGNYTITTIYGGLSVGNTINILPTIKTRDLSMNYKSGSKFNATVLDGQGNPLANQTVSFNVNGVFYNSTTAKNGIASLNVNLAVGEYIITSIWDNYQIGNKITIKQ